MIVLTKLYGQLSNALIQYVYLDAFCKDIGQDMYNPIFLKKYATHYKNLKTPTKKDLFYAFCMMKGELLFKLLVNIFGFRCSRTNKLQNNVRLFSKKKYTLVRGWYFTHYHSISTRKSYYQQLFQPTVAIKLLNETYLKRSSDEKILAVHIRRGDYINHKNGAYFYDDKLYISKIEEWLNELNSTKFRIIIFTNDHQLDTSKYTSKWNCKISTQNAFEDHFLMSQCDYILGPPSTFSLWASFMGDVPLYQIYDSKAKLKIGDFQVCDDLDASSI